MTCHYRIVYALLGLLRITPLYAQLPHADSSAAVIIVDNYLDVPVDVYVRGDSVWGKLGERPLPPGSHGLYVVPSSTLRKAPFLFLLIKHANEHQFAPLDSVPRHPGVVNVVRQILGNPPEPPPRT